MMPRLISQFTHRGSAARQRSFTLIELLVVMGIIALLGVLTALGYRGIAKDAKLASAKNTIMAVLDNARGLAMKNNEIVMVVFRPRLDGKKQFIEAVLARWTGESIAYTVNFAQPAIQTIDRFVPIPGTPARQLPTGITIAGPDYATGGIDNEWFTPSYLPNINPTGDGEAPGALLGVMYAPDGRTIMNNSKSDANYMFVDFNNDGRQQWQGTPINYNVPLNPTTVPFTGLFDQVFPDDEPRVSVVPFLAVLDDDQVREVYDTSKWSNLNQPSAFRQNRKADYTQHINNNADRIHFNRYTGVAMK